jgi:hypothetical protein
MYVSHISLIDYSIRDVNIPQDAIEQRLTERMEIIATDIEECANACDAWTKKKTIGMS